MKRKLMIYNPSSTVYIIPSSSITCILIQGGVHVLNSGMYAYNTAK